ncbi:MAG: hypothetical protein J6126_04140, partial [Clostridia bacterium]|nr:hypothetical protein [Clostridia bacterium]
YFYINRNRLNGKNIKAQKTRARGEKNLPAGETTTLPFGISYIAPISSSVAAAPKNRILTLPLSS